MELGETTSQGAARETSEEAGAQFKMGSLFTVMSVPRVGQVHLYFLAELDNENFEPGFETQEARMFAEDEIPWGRIGFQNRSRNFAALFCRQKIRGF